MKLVCNLVLVVVLFTSVAFADGELPNGNKSCPNGQTTCFVAGEPTSPDTTAADGKDSFLTTVQNYLDSIYDYFETQE